MLLVLAACGRFNFDELAADAPSASIDAGIEVIVLRDGLDNYGGTLDTFIDLANPTTIHVEDSSIRWHDDTPAVQSQQHALLRFDGLIGPQAVPQGAHIKSATLRVVMTDGCAAPEGTVADVAVDWDRSTTWDSFGATPGIQPSDLGPAIAKAPTQVGPAVVIVTASVSGWAADPAGNRGWIISPAPSNGSACSLVSSNTAEPATRPQLTVVFVRP